jgi:dTDP-4-dehydrorhamnose reductase
MRIFITGGSGLLGQYLNIELSKNHHILTQYNSNPGNCREYKSVKTEITNYNYLTEIFSSFRPEIVVHTAAVSNAERVDALPANIVFETNVRATEKIAQLCEKNNARLIYTSTDLVYAGYRGSLLSEDAKLVPISFYAESKLMGEMKIQETFGNYLILREALLLGFGLNHSRNNFHLLYQNLKTGKPVKLFSDQFRTPISLEDSARMISELIEKNVSGEILNFGGNEIVSRYDIGKIVCEISDFDKSLLTQTTMQDAGVRYIVTDVSMNNEKLKSFGVKPLSLRDSILKVIAQHEK